KWMRTNVPASKNTEIIPVILTPVSRVRKSALPHLNGVSLWRLQDFRKWSEQALTLLRELRTSFAEPGDLEWRQKAAFRFKDEGIDARGIANFLKQHKAKDELEPL